MSRPGGRRRAARSTSAGAVGPASLSSASEPSFSSLSAAIDEVKSRRKNARRDLDRERQQHARERARARESVLRHVAEVPARTLFPSSQEARLPPKLLTWAYVDAPWKLERAVHAKDLPAAPFGARPWSQLQRSGSSRSQRSHATSATRTSRDSRASTPDTSPSRRRAPGAFGSSQGRRPSASREAPRGPPPLTAAKLVLRRGEVCGRGVRALDLGCWLADAATLRVVSRCAELREVKFSPPPRATVVPRAARCSPWEDASHCAALGAEGRARGAGPDDDGLRALAAAQRGGDGRNALALQRVGLARCLEFSAAGLAALASAAAHTLVELDVSFSAAAGDAGCAAISAATQLRVLKLNGCADVGDAGLARVAAACGLLCELQLRGCRGVTDDGLSAVLQHCAALEALGAADLPLVDGDFVRHQDALGLTAWSQGATLVALYPKLTSFDVGGCGIKRPAFVTWLARACPALASLRLAHLADAVDVDGLRELAAQRVSLTALDIAGCTKAGADAGAALAQLLRLAPALAYLDASKVPKLGAAAVAAILDRAPALRTAKLDGACGMCDDLFGAQLCADAAARLGDDLSTASFGSATAPVASLLGGAPEAKRFRGDSRAPLLRVSELGLRVLAIADCGRLTPATLGCLAPRLANLQALTIGGFSGAVTDGAIAAVCLHCPQLRLLEASRPAPVIGGKAPDCFLTDAALHAIGAYLVLLEVLALEHQAYLTGRGFDGATLPYLRSLKLAGCAAIDARGLLLFSRAAPNLADLDLTGATLLSAADVAAVAEARPYVRLLFNGGAASTKLRVEALGFRPASDAGALERRDAFALRFFREDLAWWILNKCWKLYAIRKNIRRRVAAVVVLRAVRAYRKRRADKLRTEFRRLVAFNALIRRLAVRRAQRWWRRAHARRRWRAAISIQRMQRAAHAQWIRGLIRLMSGGITIIAAAWRGYAARRSAGNLGYKRLERQWQREVSEGPHRDGVYDASRTDEAVHGMAAQLEGLRARLARDRCATAAETKARIAAHRRGTPASLAVSRKRRVPVFGDRAGVDVAPAKIASGAVHVLSDGLWPVQGRAAVPESLRDIDPANHSYELKALHADRSSANAALAAAANGASAGGGRAASLSLLSSLASARLAQAKQRMLLDGVKASAERREIEAALALETLLEQEEEADRRHALMAQQASAQQHGAATTMSALARGSLARRRAAAKRLDKSRADADRALKAADTGATTVQRVARAWLLRCHNFRHGVPRFSSDDAILLQRGHLNSIRGTRTEKPAKAALALRVEADYSGRRKYERRTMLAARHSLRAKCESDFASGLEACLARLHAADKRYAALESTAGANLACGAALQVLVVGTNAATANEPNEARQADLKAHKALGELALSGCSARKQHLKYSLEAVDDCRNFALEALRLHYRRHSARRITSAEASRQLSWLSRESAAVWDLRAFVSSRRTTAPVGVEHSYYINWLADQHARVIERAIALDAEQEQLLKAEAEQLRALLTTAVAAGRAVDEVMQGDVQDAQWDAEKVGLSLPRLALPKDSTESLQMLEDVASLKTRQEKLRNGNLNNARMAFEAVADAEEKRLSRTCAFRGDGQGLARADVSSIAAVLRVPPKALAHFQRARWDDVFRAQPWLARQDVEEVRKREQRDVKRMREAQLAAMVDARRSEMAIEAADIEALETAIAEVDRKLRDPASDRLDVENCRVFIAGSTERLNVMQVDHARRLVALRKLELELDVFRAALAQEDADAAARLSAARFAKQEFERREGDADALKAADAAARRRAIEAELDAIATELAAADEEGADPISLDRADHLMQRKRALEDELREQDRLIKRQLDREAERAANVKAAAAEAAAAELAEKRKALQAELRAAKKSEAVARARAKRAKDEAEAERLAEQAQIDAELEQARRAANQLADMGLVDPEQRRKRKLDFKTASVFAKLAFRRVITGNPLGPSAAAHAEEHMLASIARRQKLGMGVATAIRAFRFTVGLEQTESFDEAQAGARARGLPHFTRLAKGIGTRDIVVVWVEETADQSEFISELQLGHTDKSNALYKKDLAKKSAWRAFTHDKLQAATATEPGFVIWAAKKPDATFVVAGMAVSYTRLEEDMLTQDGFARLEPSLKDFGFADSHLWVRMADRNAAPVIESAEAIGKELQRARKELRKRPDDPLLQDRKKQLDHKLEASRVDEEFRNRYKDNALKYAIEFLAITQGELEQWLDYFEMMDVDQLGVISSAQVLDFVGLRECKALSHVFKILAQPKDDQTIGGAQEAPQYRLDFGETVKALGSFCFFQQDELLHLLYTVFDADGNGNITHDEFLNLLSDLHPATNRGRTRRTLREIDLMADGKLTYPEMLEVHRRFPNLFYPIFDFQHKMRCKFFGLKTWERKMRAYMDVKDQIRDARGNNTDKAEAAVSAVRQRRMARAKQIEEVRGKALVAKSGLRRTLLTAQIKALNFAQGRDAFPR